MRMIYTFFTLFEGKSTDQDAPAVEKIGRYFLKVPAPASRSLSMPGKLFQRGADYAMLLVESNIRFLAQCNFRDPVIVGTAVGRIGNSSYQFQHGLFQKGICVALGETVMVCAQHGKPVTVPDDVRAHMLPMLIRGAHQ
ncbi:hypothetical protein D3C76_1073080 [compost metagenome]